jgi:peptide/nickel transport system substrate-binding protein
MDQLPEQKKSFFRRELVYLIVVLIAAVLVGTIIFLRIFSPDTQPSGPDYVEGLPKDQVKVGVFAEMDRYPLMNFEQESIQANVAIFEGLTILRNGRVAPGLAESWTNPDSLTWRIKLRAGVKFHSGAILKVSDIKYTIEEAKKNENWASNQMALRVDKVSVVDETTVELKTRKPDPTLLHWMIYLGVLSEDQIKKDGLEKAVGTGPYKIDAFNKKKVVLEANSNYWGGSPKVKKLVYIQYDDNDALAEALEAGEVDIIPLTVESRSQKLKGKGFQVISYRLTDVNYLVYDATSDKTKHVKGGKNPFKDIRVRKAILAALDIPSVITQVEGAGEALSQLAVPELIGYNSDLLKPKRNLQGAKKLLTEAGYSNGFTVTLELPFPEKSVGEEVKKQLAEAGIVVKLNIFETPDEFIGKLFSGDFALAFMGYTADTLDSADLLNTLIHTQGGGKGDFNLGRYSNSELDRLLDEASTTFNPKERSKVMKRAHAEFMEQLPLIPLYTRVGFVVMKKDLAFKPAPFGYIFGFEISGRQKATNSE